MALSLEIYPSTVVLYHGTLTFILVYFVVLVYSLYKRCIKYLNSWVNYRVKWNKTKNFGKIECGRLLSMWHCAFCYMQIMSAWIQFTRNRHYLWRGASAFVALARCPLDLFKYGCFKYSFVLHCLNLELQFALKLAQFLEVPTHTVLVYIGTIGVYSNILACEIK